MKRAIIIVFALFIGFFAVIGIRNVIEYGEKQQNLIERGVIAIEKIAQEESKQTLLFEKSK